eukprot:SAG31_NODE_434_length_15737_cov_10.315450_7_plen_188_part_00
MCGCDPSRSTVSPTVRSAEPESGLYSSAQRSKFTPRRWYHSVSRPSGAPVTSQKARTLTILGSGAPPPLGCWSLCCAWDIGVALRRVFRSPDILPPQIFSLGGLACGAALAGLAEGLPGASAGDGEISDEQVLGSARCAGGCRCCRLGSSLLLRLLSAAAASGLSCFLVLLHRLATDAGGAGVEERR